jgi:hypothetical protein
LDYGLATHCLESAGVTAGPKLPEVTETLCSPYNRTQLNSAVVPITQG